MPRSWAQLCWLLLTVASLARADGPDLLPGDTSFEVGPTSFHLRTGAAARSSRAAVESGEAADGDASVRLTPTADDPPVALELPWVRLEPGRRYTLSAFLRTDHAGRQAALRLAPATGEPTVVPFSLTTDWRRYAAPFEATAESGWYRFVIQPEPPRGDDDGTLWIDGLRLERGEATAYVPPAALGVQLDSARRLRRADESASFGVKLRAPGATGAVNVAWRLEDPFGAAYRSGLLPLTLDDGEAAGAVRLAGVPTGAWRMTVEAELAGQVLRDDTTCVVVRADLGEPLTWFGVAGADGPSGAGALGLLHIGLDVGRTGPGLTASDDELARLVSNRRAGIGSVGRLPAPAGEPGAWAAQVGEVVRHWRRLVKSWLVDPAGPAEPAPQAARLTAGAAAARAADPGAHLVTLRLDARRLTVLREAQALAQAGAWRATDSVGLEVGSEPPERTAGRGVAGLVAALGRLGAAEGAPRPVAVLIDGWPAEPWSREVTASPTGAADRVDALSQASYLARTVLLSRAGGAAAVLYNGAPVADREDVLTLAASGQTPDLYDATGAPLPAVAALDQVLGRLHGRGLAERLELGHEVACYRWAGARPLVTLWQWHRPGEAWTLSLPLDDDQVVVSDLFGRAVPLREGPVRLAVTEHPLYIEARHVSGAAFVAAWRQATLAGAPPVEAQLVPTGEGAAVAVRNVVDHPVSGLLVAQGPEGNTKRLFGPVAPGATARLALAGSLPEDVEVAVRGRLLTDVGEQPVARAVRAVRAPAGAPRRWVPLTRLHAGEVLDAERFAARFAAGWDAQALTVTVAVRDAEVRPTDAVELMLDPQPEEPFAPDALDRLLYLRVAPDGRLLEAPRGVAGSQVQATRTDDGYTVTLRLPWDRLGPPVAGRALGLDVGAIETEADGALRSHLRWRGAARTRAAGDEMGWLVLTG